MLLGLHFILLHVADIEEAAAFYTEKFGLTIEDQNPMFVQFKPGVGGGAVLALSQGESKPDAGTELWWFVDNVNATLADLQARGVEVVNPLADEPFGRTCAIKAPGGYTLYLLQPAQQG